TKTGRGAKKKKKEEEEERGEAKRPRHAAQAAAPRPAAQPQTRAERRAEVLSFLEQNRNANTQATYASGWRQFVKWATEVENAKRAEGEKLDAERPEGEDIAAYLIYLVKHKGRKMGTVTAA